MIWIKPGALLQRIDEAQQPGLAAVRGDRAVQGMACGSMMTRREYSSDRQVLVPMVRQARAAVAVAPAIGQGGRITTPVAAGPR